jgi:hypothetical protein
MSVRDLCGRIKMAKKLDAGYWIPHVKRGAKYLRGRTGRG